MNATHERFKNAQIPEHYVSSFNSQLLQDLIVKYENPIELRREIFDLIFYKSIRELFIEKFSNTIHTQMAVDLAKFFYEDYPELWTKQNKQETVDLIVNQVNKAIKQGNNHAFTEFIKENFVFSKFRKLKNLVTEELVSPEILSISFEEFALQMLVDQNYSPKVEKIFTDYGFDYPTKYVYGEEQEIRLDGGLRVLINEIYNMIKR